MLIALSFNADALEMQNLQVEALFYLGVLENEA